MEGVFFKNLYNCGMVMVADQGLFVKTMEDTITFLDKFVDCRFLI